MNYHVLSLKFDDDYYFWKVISVSISGRFVPDKQDRNLHNKTKYMYVL